MTDTVYNCFPSCQVSGCWSEAVYLDLNTNHKHSHLFVLFLYIFSVIAVQHRKWKINSSAIKEIIQSASQENL